MSEFLEGCHDAVVGGEAMSVFFGLKWFHQDGVGVNVESQHDVVVDAVGAYWESTHIISIELSDGLHLNEQFL